MARAEGWVTATIRSKDGAVLSTVMLGGRYEVWSKGLTLGRAGTNAVVVDQEGVAPLHARVTVGGGHHPCYFVEVVEEPRAPEGPALQRPASAGGSLLLLEMSACLVEIE